MTSTWQPVHTALKTKPWQFCKVAKSQFAMGTGNNEPAQCLFARVAAKTLRLTEDSHDHAAGSHLPADLVFHGALVRPAVLGHGLDNEEGVNDLVGQDVLGVNGLHSLQEE